MECLYEGGVWAAMNFPCRMLYGAFVETLRLYRRCFLDLHVWGRDRIPQGPKIFVTNHVTSTDPYWVLPEYPEPVHIIIGPGYQSKVMGWVYDRFEQINAMPAARHQVVDKAVALLERGRSIYTAPEGDLQNPFSLGRFFPGVGRIYRRSRAPIVPIALLAPRSIVREFPRLAMNVDGRTYRAEFVLSGLYCIHIGEPFRPQIRGDLDPEVDARRIADELRDRVQSLIFEIRDRLMPGVDWVTPCEQMESRSGSTPP